MALRRPPDGLRDNRDKNRQRVNERIRVPQVRVITEEGEQLGIMNTADALDKARQAGLDLVEVAADSKPPVCRIMDYGKYRYQQKKRLSKTHVHQSKLKEDW
jgi:translation initiation factor IF-3